MSDSRCTSTFGHRLRTNVVLEVAVRGIGSLRITGGGTRDEIRSFRERARAAHDYSADISDKVQRGRKRWAGKSYWGGRCPYGRMIDPAAPKHAKQLITSPPKPRYCMTR